MTDNLNPPITIIPEGIPHIIYKDYHFIDIDQKELNFETNTEVFRFLERKKLDADGIVKGVFIRHV